MSTHGAFVCSFHACLLFFQIVMPRKEFCPSVSTIEDAVFVWVVNKAASI